MAIGYGSDDSRILSTPVDVEWMGWRTDTLRLQQYGWRLAVSFDPYRNQYQLLIKHEQMELCGISDMAYIRMTNDMRLYNSKVTHDIPPFFRVQYVARHIKVHQIMTSCSLGSFEEIDARPQFTREKIVDLYDLNVFSTKRVEQVIIDKADMTVIEHLEAIKNLQVPKQKELRRKAMDEENNDKPRIHLVAQLVHYEEAA